ncbi:MAG: Transcriptional regulator superfamily [Dehalococcoidia bacterium]|nr:Transcriptional regulator superfamily [Dehalococcoidia bacterium]
MKLSSRSEYGLRAMVELAQSYGSGPLALADIARAQGLSEGYLEQIIAPLRRAGLVLATRGVKGGYTLAASPKSITAGQIMRALEGPLDLIECASEYGSESSCKRELACGSRRLWLKLRDSIVDVLDSTTLADLCTGDSTPGDKKEKPRHVGVLAGQ